MTPNRGNQIEGREAGVRDDDNFALRQPSPHLENSLACPIVQLLVMAPARSVVTFGGRQNSQEGQRLTSPRPWDRNHDHRREPTQAARLDEMTV